MATYSTNDLSTTQQARSSKAENEMDVLFVDVHTFSAEGFTSGLLICVRDTLVRLQERGYKVGVLSFADVAAGEPSCTKSVEAEGIPIVEVLVKSESVEQKAASYRDAIRKHLLLMSPRVVFVTTAAVFLSEVNVVHLEECISSGSSIHAFLQDELFPKSGEHPDGLYKRYYDALRQFDVMTNTDRIRASFLAETGIEASYFPSLIQVESVLSRTRDSPSRITLINHHPIKGREIFHHLAMEMPDERFLIVENWPDVPPYTNIPSNMELVQFCADVRIIYARTKVLLVPSLWNEGTARVILEAMINDIPVAAHTIGSLPETYGDNVTWIEPPAFCHQLEGTVLYPKLSKVELRRVVDDFKRAVCELSEFSENQTAKAKEFAMGYCRQAEHDVIDCIYRWLLEK